MGRILRFYENRRFFSPISLVRSSCLAFALLAGRPPWDAVTTPVSRSSFFIHHRSLLGAGCADSPFPSWKACDERAAKSSQKWPRFRVWADGRILHRNRVTDSGQERFAVALLRSLCLLLWANLRHRHPCWISTEGNEENEESAGIAASFCFPPSA